MKQARGLRNNNPLNIVQSTRFRWNGEIMAEEKIFCVFETMGQGCRATLKLLRTYYEKHHCNTISKIIRRWAPETENNVLAYIKSVCRQTGIEATTPLPPMKEETKDLWCDIVLAMATVECGLDAQGREELAPSIDVGWRLLNP